MATYSNGDHLENSQQCSHILWSKLPKDELVPVTTPVRTPSVSSRIAGIQKILQEQVSSSSKHKRSNDDVSPTLLKLRNTPASSFPVKQLQLTLKHDDISRQKSHKLTKRGGVCLWPKMKSLQLTHFDLLWLIVQVIMLCLLTVIILIKFHGKTLTELQSSLSDMKAFCDSHHINLKSPVSSVADQVSFWHNTLLHKTETLQNRFDLSNMTAGYCMYLMCYILGLSALSCCLAGSLRVKERLTLPYIRLWLCLLTVICTWTLVIGITLYRAYQLELQVISCVQQYSLSVAKNKLLNHMSGQDKFLLIFKPKPSVESYSKIGSSMADLTAHQSILLYWKSQFLDVSSHGLLHIAGPITVKDLVCYLVYYSVPILTVLFGPVVRLCVSCWNVYSKSS